jgi:hypothetical protein
MASLRLHLSVPLPLPPEVGARLLARALRESRARTLGDKPGHEFHGNQYTTYGQDRQGPPAATLEEAHAQGFTEGPYYHATDFADEIMKGGVLSKGAPPDEVREPGSMEEFRKWGAANPVFISPNISDVVQVPRHPLYLTATSVEEAAAKGWHGGQEAYGKDVIEFWAKPGTVKNAKGMTMAGGHYVSDPKHLIPIKGSTKPATLKSLGDVAGHEFHGNQWTEGQGGVTPPHALSEDKAYINSVHAFTDKLSEREAEALDNYILDEKNSATLDRVVGKAPPLPAPVTTYRGVNEERYRDVKVGDEIEPHSALSTSLNPKTALDFAKTKTDVKTVLRIQAGRGLWLPATGMAASREDELLLPRNRYKLTIKSVADGELQGQRVRIIDAVHERGYASPRALGEGAGHEFHGNQWTGGGGESKSTYVPQHDAPKEGRWDYTGVDPNAMGGPGPKWEQQHTQLVHDALQSWTGDPGAFRSHAHDVVTGAPAPGSGSGKEMRARAEALLWELDHKAVSNDVPLYRGSGAKGDKPGQPFTWTEDRRVASNFAKKYGGRVETLPAGSVKGLRFKDYSTGGAFNEKQWLVRAGHQPRALAAAKPETHLHRLADAHLPSFRVAVRYAFAAAREAVKGVSPKEAPEVARRAVKTALLKVLPATLQTLQGAVGEATVLRLGSRSLQAPPRALGGPGSGNFGHGGRPGEVGGSAPNDGGPDAAAPFVPPTHEIIEAHRLHAMGVAPTGIATRMKWGLTSHSRGKLVLGVLSRFNPDGTPKAVPTPIPRPKSKDATPPEPTPPTERPASDRQNEALPIGATDFDSTSEAERQAADNAIAEVQRVAKEHDIPVDLRKISFVTGTYTPTPWKRNQDGRTWGYYVPRNGYAKNGVQLEGKTIVMGTGSQTHEPDRVQSASEHNAGTGIDFVMRHELGHNVQDSSSLAAKQEWGKLFGNAEYGYGKSPLTYAGKKAAKGVSIYAKKNSKELFAESFALYTHKDYGTDKVRRLPDKVHDYMTKHFPRLKAA